ncbi:MAG: ABC transporter substrate-binding protein, partial [Anaerolineales bacterium]
MRLIVLSLAMLTACRAPVTPTPTLEPGATAAPATATLSASAATASPPAPTAAASPTPAGPREMTICLTAEPRSLYRYARPEAGRAHILAALTDGPIDVTHYSDQPVLIERLPSLDNGGIALRQVDVVPGEMVLDVLDRARPLANGMTLRLAEGSETTYSGTLPIQLPQLTVTFHLRPDLRWSDGAPLTAGDSMFAYELGRSPDSFDPLAQAAAGTARYSAPNDQTVVWTGLPGNLDPRAGANFWPPLPRHQFAELSASDIADTIEASRTLLSYGPFAVREWTPGQQLVVERNPFYWRAGEGLPRLDRITYRFVADASTLMNDLRAGDCDLAPSGAAPADSPAAADGLVHYSVAGDSLLHLDFDLAPAGDYTGTARSGLWQDAGLRQALAYCLDRPALGGGQAPPAAFLPREHPHYAADAVEYPFNAQHGRQLLGARGW